MTMWQECEKLQDYIVGLRRDLHRIPETGTDLPKTQAYICAELDRLGVSYAKNKGDSGIIGEIKGGKPGKTVLLRADIDALPIHEETGLPFASEHEGRMHACGHDTHAAMLIGALKVLNEHREALSGNVKFVFQTAEEISKGSQIAIKEGVMDGVDAVFGIHIGSILGPSLPSGTISVVPGCCMASFDRFVPDGQGERLPRLDAGKRHRPGDHRLQRRAVSPGGHSARDSRNEARGPHRRNDKRRLRLQHNPVRG